MEGIVYDLQSLPGKLQSAIVDGISRGKTAERRICRTLSAPEHQSFQLHRPANSGSARTRYSRKFLRSQRRKRYDEDRSARRRVFRNLHDQRADSRFARRSVLAMDYRWFRCDFVESGQWRLRFGGDVRHSFCDANLRWNWRRRLRPGCANNLVRSFPDRNTRPGDGDFLRRDSGRQRAGLCHRRVSRCSPRLALGILSRGAAGFAAGSALFLATRSARYRTSPGARIAASQPEELPEAFPNTLLSHQLRRTNLDDFCNRWFGILGIGVSGISKSKPSHEQDDLRTDHCSRWSDLD